MRTTSVQQRASEEDIDCMCASLSRLLQHLDAAFSIAYKGQRVVTDQDKANFSLHVTKLDLLWKKCHLGYPVKLHVLVCHVKDYLGNGERTEEFMEQQHQIGDSFNARNRIRGHSIKRRKMADMEALRNDETIKSVGEEVLKKARYNSTKRRAKREVLKDKTKAERVDLLSLEELEGYRAWKDILKDEMRPSYHVL